MPGLSYKKEGFQLSYISKRSTLSDAKKNRKVNFFKKNIHYYHFLEASF